MSVLTTLNWKKIARGSAVVTTNAPAEILDGIYTSCTTGSYYNGGTKTPGTTGPTYSRFQSTGSTEAVYWTHPTGDHKSIIAGQGTATKSPSMRTPDTFVANVLIAEVTKTAGAFNAWDNAAPFTSGRNFAYWRWAGVSTGSTWQWDIYECKEAWAIVLNINTNATPAALMIGAHLDPHSVLAADAESDGRLIGQMTGNSGVSTSIATNSDKFDGANQNQFGDYHSSANTNHHGVLQPGLSSIDTVERSFEWDSQDTNFMTTVGGRNILHLGLPIHNESDNTFRGSTRQWGLCRQVPLGAVFQSGGTDVGYAWASNSWTLNNTTYVLAA